MSAASDRVAAYLRMARHHSRARPFEELMEPDEAEQDAADEDAEV